MKFSFAVCLVLLNSFLSRASAQAPGPHQWVELPPAVAPAWCDLAQAAVIRVAGDRVTAEQPAVTADGSDTAYSLFEDNTTVAQAILKAVQATPERWLRVDTEAFRAEVLVYINLEAVASVIFQTDERGPSARIILRGESIADPHRAAKNPAAGHLVRGPVDLDRLRKFLTARH